MFPSHQQQQVRIQLAGTLQGILSQQLLPTVDGRASIVRRADADTSPIEM